MKQEEDNHYAWAGRKAHTPGLDGSWSRLAWTSGCFRARGFPAQLHPSLPVTAALGATGAGNAGTGSAGLLQWQQLRSLTAQSIAKSSTDTYSGFRRTQEFRCDSSLWSMKVPRNPDYAASVLMLVHFPVTSRRPWVLLGCGVAWICLAPRKSSVWEQHPSSMSILILTLSLVSIHQF